MAKSTLQTLIGTVGFVIVCIVALNMLGSKFDSFSAGKHQTSRVLPASLTLNMGGQSWTCTLTSGSAYRCILRMPQAR